MTEADATALVNSLPAQDFECRRLIAGIDDQDLAGAYGRCWWHPSFRRINVMPDGLELVWYNVGEAESPDLRVTRILSPNQAVDCTLANPPRFPQEAGVAGLTQGDVSGLMDRVHD